MPCAGEHDAPLRLVCGPDPALVAAWRLLFGLALSAALLSNWPVPWKAGFLLVAGAAWSAAERSRAHARSRVLLVAPEGQVQYGERRGQLLERAWLSSRWAVIQLRLEGRREQLLVSRALQREGEYRKLLAWMRWRRWEYD